jgi:hypothetical protein
MFTFATKDMVGDSGSAHELQNVWKCECAISETLLSRSFEVEQSLLNLRKSARSVKWTNPLGREEWHTN